MYLSVINWGEIKWEIDARIITRGQNMCLCRTKIQLKFK